MHLYEDSVSEEDDDEYHKDTIGVQTLNSHVSTGYAQSDSQQPLLRRSQKYKNNVNSHKQFTENRHSNFCTCLYCSCCSCILRNSIRHTLSAILIGSIAGVLVFWGTTCALYIISVNELASMIFGFLLLAISCNVAIHTANPFTEVSMVTRLFTLAFAVILLLASIFCFLLDKKVILMAKSVKVPLYSVVNVALTFAISFPFSILSHTLVFDYILWRKKNRKRKENENKGLGGASDAYPMNSGMKAMLNRRPNSGQTCTIFCASFILGIFYGTIFGLLDIEDAIPADHEGEIFIEALVSKTAEAHSLALDR